MKRSLRSVDSTGDTVTFASELSTSFFTALQEACQSFSALFEEHYTKPEILNLLLNWVQKQVASYVEILIPHVSLHDYSAPLLLLFSLASLPSARIRILVSQ
jgi:hypothetical protein